MLVCSLVDRFGFVGLFVVDVLVWISGACRAFVEFVCGFLL